MKYYWAKWKDKLSSPNSFVVGVEDGYVYRVAGSDDYPCYHRSLERLMSLGLIIGPEIPGPPEEWR